MALFLSNFCKEAAAPFLMDTDLPMGVCKSYGLGLCHHIKNCLIQVSIRNITEKKLPFGLELFSYV